MADEAQVRDPYVTRAIALMRAELDARWTVSTLARRVGLSRAAFARRFAASMRTSPRKYLARLRMQRAAQLLGESSHPLAQIAAWVGYDSEFAFNRAFKRHRGIAPGQFRRSAQGRFSPVCLAA